MNLGKGGIEIQDFLSFSLRKGLEILSFLEGNSLLDIASIDVICTTDPSPPAE